MISDFLIHAEKTIEEALSQLDKVKGLGLVVVDQEGNLLGSLTDGDVRRAILNGKKVQDSISDIFNTCPKFVDETTPREELLKMTDDKRIKMVPVVSGKKVVEIFTVDDHEMKNFSVVIMAGGLGSRLGNMTKDCPKPMLEVGGKPILERIIHNFTNSGFRKFYLSVNYKAEMIESYFGDGSGFNCEVSYLKEKTRLGTAGALSLLPKEVRGPVVVTNGDLLTMVDYRRLVSFHLHHKTPITMCTRTYEFQVPFGVVDIQNGKVEGISEKPTQSFNVSAGVYVIDSELFSDIPRDQYFDMPTFIEELMKKGIKPECFPLVEQWIDVGRVSDLDYARSLYGNDK